MIDLERHPPAWSCIDTEGIQTSPRLVDGPCRAAMSAFSSSTCSEHGVARSAELRAPHSRGPPRQSLLRCAPRAGVGCRIDDAECGGGGSVPSACLERNGGTAERGAG